MSDQLKWKETWDTEQQLRKIKQTVEQGVKPVALKQFSPSIEPLEKPVQPSHAKSRTVSLTPLNQRKAQPGVFITDEAQEEHVMVSRSKDVNDKAQYPWEKRERSREQYKTIAEQL